MKPKALDLFCGAGGATKGLQAAGFYVVGIDKEPQPQYCGDAFIQADALALTTDQLRVADFVWASPPCQAYTSMQNINKRGPKRDHPKLVEPIRALLQASGVHYVIENVPGAPLLNPVTLCGTTFNIGVRRHRLFETSFLLHQPECAHRGKARAIAVYGDHPQQPGDKMYRVNRARTLAEGQQAMGICWMDWKPLTQAIPPAYAEYIGRAAIEHIRQRVAA